MIAASLGGGHSVVVVGGSNQWESAANIERATANRTPVTRWVVPKEADRLQTLAGTILADSIRSEALFRSLASGEPVDPEWIYSTGFEILQSIIRTCRASCQIIQESTNALGIPAAEQPRQVDTKGVAMVSAPISPIVERIRGFSHLPQNWDGYGAAQVAPVALGEAGSLLVASLDTPVYTLGTQVDVALTPTGGILVEWRSDTRRLQVVIHEDGRYTGFTADVHGGRTSSRTTLTEPNRAAALAELATWGDA